MSKDPAILFYTSDFISGTLTMTDEQRGKYIILLCLQHQQGSLSEEDMLNICKTYDLKIFGKFVKGEDGMYYNERLREETDKRQKYSLSRSNNRKQPSHEKHMNNICSSYDKHMENVNENVIEVINEKGKYKNIPPQLSEISERMAERGITSFTADAFFAFYESKGWKVGNSKMKNWDAALTTWNGRDSGTATKAPTYAPKYKNYDEMCQAALTNSDIWKQMIALKLPDMPKTVWAHPNDVARHGLEKYKV